MKKELLDETLFGKQKTKGNSMKNTRKSAYLIFLILLACVNPIIIDRSTWTIINLDTWTPM